MSSTMQVLSQEAVSRLAEEFNLICTGGSDYHGTGKPDIALGTGRGNLAVPESMLEDLKRVRAENRPLPETHAFRRGAE